jgi:hypothetical protein
MNFASGPVTLAASKMGCLMPSSSLVYAYNLAQRLLERGMERLLFL